MHDNHTIKIKSQYVEIGFEHILDNNNVKTDKKY